MRSKLVSLIILLVILYMPSMAIELQNSKLDIQMQSLKNSGSKAIDLYTSGDYQDDEFDIGFGADESIYEFDYKSPKKAFVYSLLIPGWGQKYAEASTFGLPSTMKTILFIGVEAGLWMGYFKNRNDGNKATDEFEAFGDEHWIEGDPSIPESYRGWLATGNGDTSYVESEFTHELPEYKDQQYYEMIGKYDQFRGGWDDYWLDQAFYEDTLDDGTIANLSPNRVTYNQMRGHANDLLDKANTFIVISIANHLLSAIDAALSAKRFNRKKAAELWLSFDMDMKKYSATEEIPVIKATLRF